MMKFWDKQALSPYTSRSVGVSRGSRDLTGNGPRNTSNDPLKPAPLDSIKIEVPWISENQKATTDNTDSTTRVLKFDHSLEISQSFVTNGDIKSATPPPVTAELSNASTASPSVSRKIPSETLSSKSMGLLEPLQPIKLIIEINGETLSDEKEIDNNNYDANTDEEEVDILDRSDVVSDFSEIV